MFIPIKLKRGIKPNLPVLDEGMPAFTTDTEELFVGSKDGNIQFAKQTDVAANTAYLADMALNINGRSINVLHPPVPLIACKGDGTTDDTSVAQNIINSANTNGYSSVYFQPTTNGYVINGTLTLYSGLTVFGQRTKITSASTTAVTAIFFSNGLNNVKVHGFRIFSTNNQVRPTGWTGQSSNRTGVQFSGCNDCFAFDLYGEQLEYLVKIDSTSSNNTIKDVETVNVLQPIYIGITTGTFLENCNLGMPTDLNCDPHDHHIYISQGSNIQGNNITCNQGCGFAIQIYNVAGTQVSNINFTNLILKNVRAGLYATLATNVTFTNVDIDGINSDVVSQVSALYVTDAEMFVENLKIKNIGNLQGGQLFYADGATSATLKVNGGYIDNGGTATLGTFNTQSDVILNDIVFNLCEGQFYSSSTANHRKFIMRSSTYIRNATTITTPATIELFRLRGTTYAEVEGCTFVNAQSNARAILYCTDNTGLVVAKNNTYKGDTVFISPSDTKTKGSNNFDANNNVSVTSNSDFDLNKNKMKNMVLDQNVTASRPTSPVKGQAFYDTTLNKPIWHNGTSWTDATGTTV